MLDYFNYYFTTATDQKEVGGVIETKINLPGVKKDQISITYNDDQQLMTIFVDDEMWRWMSLPKKIDSEKATAELSLGVLTVKTPVKNTDKHIQIE